LPKTKPAALVRPPASKSRSSSQHGLDRRAANPSKARSANFPPAAELRPAPWPPDIFGESDASFFALRLNARQRFRLPFPGELPPEVWQPAAAAGLAAFLIVSMKRDAAGAPSIRTRSIFFAAGGTA
jgi:hypothetical protein